MNNKKLRNFLKKTKPNSGFTLVELLTGLIMSIFVTGALGFGLYQILQVTAREDAKSNARNEASRAIEFISDELRRAQTIETDATNANDNDTTIDNTFDATGKTIVLALNIPEINDSATLGSDADASTSERIVYYLEDSSGNWQGPQVLYRWGPPLDANGNYTNGTWQAEALIDGIDDTTIDDIPTSCDPGDTLSPPLDLSDPTNNPSGFYACVNATQTTAQIFLTGGIDTIANNDNANDENYTAETRVVTRSRTANVNNAETGELEAVAFKTLGADYVCDSRNGSIWTMRMDFDTDPYDSDIDSSTTKWKHEAGRQSQPINIDRDKPNDLTMYSVPIESSSCLSRGNEGTTMNDDLSSMNNSIPHSIKFREDLDDDPDDNIDPPRVADANFWKTFNGDHSDTNYNNPNVDPEGRVIVLKNGSVLRPIPADPANPQSNELSAIDFAGNVADAPLYPGLDPDGASGPEPQRQSLGEFLADVSNFPGDPHAPYAVAGENGTYIIQNLDSRDRIVAFEVGHDDNGFNTDENGNIPQRPPGFDMQDNLLIMRHDIFGNDHADTSD